MKAMASDCSKETRAFSPGLMIIIPWVQECFIVQQELVLTSAPLIVLTTVELGRAGIIVVTLPMGKWITERLGQEIAPSLIRCKIR